MVHIDVPRVRGKIAEKGYNLSTLAMAIGVDRNTLSGYLSEPRKIPYSVLSVMAELLCENADEAKDIFFAADLRNA